MRSAAGEPGITMAEGPVAARMAADHARLDALLERVEAEGLRPGPSYDEFREGLLRHMWIEEHVLIPLAGKDGFDRLKQDHGALTALLVPVPTPGILSALRGILGPHNGLEEAPQGLYALCDRASGAGAGAAMDRAPRIPLRPCDPGGSALAACRRAVLRAGYDPDRWIPTPGGLL